MEQVAGYMPDKLFVRVLGASGGEKRDCIIQIGTAIIMHAPYAEALADNLFAREADVRVGMHHAHQYIGSSKSQHPQRVLYHGGDAANLEYNVNLPAKGIHLCVRGEKERGGG